MRYLKNNIRLYVSSFVLVFVSALTAAYAPLNAVSYAQSSTGKLKTVLSSSDQTIKDKTIAELERRISEYTETLKSLEVNVSISKDKSTFALCGQSASTKEQKCESTSIESQTTDKSKEQDCNNAAQNTAACGKTVKGSDFKIVGSDNGVAPLKLQDGFKDKVKEYLKTLVDQLKSTLEKVKSADTSELVQSLAKNVDGQYGIDQLTQVSASITQAVDSMSGVYENLKTTFDNLQGQFTAFKACTTGVIKGDTTAKIEMGSNTIEVECGEFNLSGENSTAEIKAQLDNLSTMMSTVSSVTASSVGLLSTLMSTFSSTLSGFSSSDSNGTGLSGLGNLGSLLSGSGLDKLTGSSTSLTGLMSSFTAISSQLDLANSISSTSVSGLQNISKLINK